MEKITDALLQELWELERDIKVKELRAHQIKEICKEKGSCTTKHFVCMVEERTRNSMASITKVIDALGRDVLDQYDLIKSTKYLEVRISPKHFATNFVL